MNFQNDLRTEKTSRGFSLADLLAVVFMGGVIFLVLLPAVAARPGLNAKSFECLNNIRQLVNAWRMYADDNRDVMLFASTGGAASSRNGSSVPLDTAYPSDPNNFAWTGCHLDFSAVNRGNWDTNYDIVRRPLWSYTSRNAAIYKCPADPSILKNLTGAWVRRVQSYSLNTYLGGFAPTFGGTGTDGGWTFAAAYRIYSKTTDLTTPGPVNTLAFLDMSSPGDNWGNFLTDMTGYLPQDPSLYDLTDGPGFYHDGGGTVSFADGHAVIHRWMDSRTLWTSVPILTASPNNQDMAWLQDHATRPK